MESLAKRSSRRHESRKTSKTRGGRRAPPNLDAQLVELEARLGEAIVSVTRLVASVVAGNALDDITDLGDIRATLGAALCDVRPLVTKAAGR